MKGTRLDQRCVELGLTPSREQARALILAGQVLVDEQPVTKAGAAVSATAVVRLRGEALPYVSRGGLKLAAALDHFSLDVAGLVALDVGASTGGFTDCLLQRGARHVIAVDVGYGQLAWKLRQDPRVTCLERVNARHLEAEALRAALRDESAWPPELAVIDVSFISLTLVLPAVERVLGPDRPILALVKPQFEAGRGQVGKGGVVRDETVRQGAIRKVVDWAVAARYTVVGGLDSPWPGPSGNVEHLALFRTPPDTTS
ncbi:MAG: TlyA family RNA methyltransferase [Deltaproteobacteria bacterium]|nr:TlyA family RNA methyltransferase [Deltaproteobacteria bacterium]